MVNLNLNSNKEISSWNPPDFTDCSQNPFKICAEICIEIHTEIRRSISTRNEKPLAGTVTLLACNYFMISSKHASEYVVQVLQVKIITDHRPYHRRIGTVLFLGTFDTKTIPFAYNASYKSDKVRT